MSVRCFFNFHALVRDPQPVNGVWWAFCGRCGARFAGEYDPCYGETIWKPK